jgi:hypothetical protein
LREIRVQNIPMTEDTFTIDVMGNVDVDLTVSHYTDYHDIYKGIEVKLKKNGFVTRENRFKILEFLEDSRQEIENAIKHFRRGY